MHGHGVMRVGDSYVEGEFKCGEIEGFCVRTWSEADGAVRKRYRGSFVRGEMHGRGELCTRTERYVGEFVRNKRQGQFTNCPESERRGLFCDLAASSRKSERRPLCQARGRSRWRAVRSVRTLRVSGATRPRAIGSRARGSATKSTVSHSIGVCVVKTCYSCCRRRRSFSRRGARFPAAPRFP